MPPRERQRGAIYNPAGLKAKFMTESAALQRGKSTLKEFEEDDDDVEGGDGPPLPPVAASPSTWVKPSEDRAIKSQWTSPGSILAHPSRFNAIKPGSPVNKPHSKGGLSGSLSHTFSFSSPKPQSSKVEGSMSAVDKFNHEQNTFNDAAPHSLASRPTGFLARLFHSISGPVEPLSASAALTLKVFTLLGLTTSELSKLRDIFRKIDNDKSGKISYDEFVAYADIEDSDFLRKVFLAMDSDNSGSMDLREFILNLWNYCSLEKSGLILFAYDLYDNDKNGTLSTDEVKAMFMQVFGKEFGKGRVGDTVMNSLEQYVSQRESDYGSVGKQDFVRLVTDHPNVLMPAFHVQMTLRNLLGGTSFWSKITSRRSKAALEGLDPWFQISALTGESGKVAKKVDAKAVMKKYQKNVAEQALQELVNNHKRKLIGRLGEFNPVLHGDKRMDRYLRLKMRTLDLFEDLQYLHSESALPRVLTEPKSLVAGGKTSSVDIPVHLAYYATKGVWVEGTDCRPKNLVDKDVAEIRTWYETVSDAMLEEDLLDKPGGIADVKAGTGRTEATIGYTLKNCHVGPTGRKFNLEKIVDVRKLTIFNSG